VLQDQQMEAMAILQLLHHRKVITGEAALHHLGQFFLLAAVAVLFKLVNLRQVVMLLVTAVMEH
jgi:hypothetical protein